jgi:hypothetical protein
MAIHIGACAALLRPHGRVWRTRGSSGSQEHLLPVFLYKNPTCPAAAKAAAGR